jgi:hypothetical protein
MLLALGLSITLDELAIGFTIGLLHLSITAAADTTTSAVRRMPKAPNVIANPPSSSRSCGLPGWPERRRDAGARG